MTELIDSHCHLDFPVFDANRSDLISRCNAAGIKHFVVPGVEAKTWQRLIKLRNDFPNIHIAFGLHPYFIDKHQIQDLDQLQEYCKQYNPVAVGEIGLDYYRKDLSREKQILFFEKQLEIAEQFNLPVILHVRKAHQDVLALLKKFKLPGGIAHAFNGSYEQAMQYIDLGFKLGFGGAVTYPNATKLRALAEKLPLDSIVLETDSPDMKPFNYHDEFNTPLTLIAVLDTLSQIRNIPKNSLIEQFEKNTQQYIS